MNEGGNAILKRCLLSLERNNGIEKTSFGYQEGVSSRVVDQ